jgi:hypothetical protein
MDFLQELEQITNAYSNNSALAPQQQQQELSHTAIANPENPENWFTTAAQSQDYKALNQEIESDRVTSKVYVGVGSGLATLGGNACLGNWTLEQTHNPYGYMVFSGVIALSLVAGGLSGSRIEGKRLYSSPWLLSSIGASAGVIGGSYAASRPYFQDLNVAKSGRNAMQTEIREIEVKPQSNKFDLYPYLIPIVGLIAVAFLFLKKQ